MEQEFSSNREIRVSRIDPSSCILLGIGPSVLHFTGKNPMTCSFLTFSFFLFFFFRRTSRDRRGQSDSNVYKIRRNICNLKKKREREKKERKEN